MAQEVTISSGDGETRIVWNDAAAQAILKGVQVQAELMARGTAIASAAEAASGDGAEYTAVVSRRRKTRTGVRVFTSNYAARRAEAENRTLSASLDAGRG